MTGMLVTAAAGVTALTVLVTTGAVQAASGTAATSGVTVTVSVDDAVRFDGPGCARVSWDGTYQRTSEVDFTVGVELRREGSNSPETDYADVASWASNTGTFGGDFCVSDYYFDASAGPFKFSGTLHVDTLDGRPIGATQLPTATLPVRQNRSRISGLKVRSRSKTAWGSVRGRVTARTLTKGRLGAAGTIKVEVKQNGRWRHVIRLYPNEFGKFASGGELYTVRPIPKGAKVRARLIECGWCTNTMAATRAR
jgi:hypothetical protein